MADIDITHEDRISTIMMSDRERKDTLSSEAYWTMVERLCKCAPSVQWIVVEGKGGAFCSGIDPASEMDVASPAKNLEGELIQRTNGIEHRGMPMNDRELSFWGWGYAEKFPDDAERRVLKERIETLLDFPERPLLDPPTVEDV